MDSMRKFNNKAYNRYTWHKTLELATKRAEELRAEGAWLVRVVKSQGRYGTAGQGYTLWTRMR